MPTTTATLDALLATRRAAWTAHRDAIKERPVNVAAWRRTGDDYHDAAKAYDRACYAADPEGCEAATDTHARACEGQRAQLAQLSR